MGRIPDFINHTLSALRHLSHSLGLVPSVRAVEERDRLITAKEDDRPHTQTVARVMKFVDDFGDSGVEIIKRRGQRKVVFDEELVECIKQGNHDRCDWGAECECI